MSMITVAEAAENWGISVQLVRRYCREKRIPEAVMYDGIWFIPDDASRPDREESEPAAIIDISEEGGELHWESILTMRFVL